MIDVSVPTLCAGLICDCNYELMKKTVYIVTGITVLLVIAGVIVFSRNGVDMAAYEHLKQPSIRTISNQKVIAMTLTGDPGKTAGNAFGKLYKAYYKLPSHQPAAPRARWTNVNSHKEMTGEFAMPVSNDVTQLPEGTDPVIELKEWPYGQVAEILHTGAYDSEDSSVQKLMTFVKEHGYEALGPHEEEYLKGPGMFNLTSPKKYKTIIRYRVRKIQDSGVDSVF
jgi:effector-binding domain-containing protein